MTLEVIDPHGEERGNAALLELCGREAADLPMRVRINHAPPAASIERRPFALSLRQAVGHRIDGGGVMAHAAMAALDFDAL